MVSFDHVDFLSNSVPWMPAMKNQEYIYALTQDRDYACLHFLVQEFILGNKRKKNSKGSLVK